MSKSSQKRKKNKEKNKKGATAGGEGVKSDTVEHPASDVILYDLSYPKLEEKPRDMGGLDIRYSTYRDESQLAKIQEMAERDLSEPYSVFTYRYFLLKWPELCICASVPRPGTDSGPSATNTSGDNDDEDMIGTILCKSELVDESDPSMGMKGYIAMLIVDKNYRKRGIGQQLSMLAIHKMIAQGCEQIILETEACNKGAVALYEKLGFVREEMLSRYYLNCSDAYRMKLLVDPRYYKPPLSCDEDKEGSVKCTPIPE